MEIASLILSIIALILSIACVVYNAAKHFSSHQIQMVPADTWAPLGKAQDSSMAEVGDKEPDVNFFERF